MRIIIFGFLLLLSNASNGISQTKYLIFFTDKGFGIQNGLLKSVELIKIAERHLSHKAIERRIKTLGRNNYLTFDDLPVSEKYINSLNRKGIKIINRLKWFNAVSAYLTGKQINEVKNLPFVKELRPVQKFKIRRGKVETENKPVFLKVDVQDEYVFNYGPSFQQYELSQIPEVHNLGITGEGVTIGILDNGFRWKVHPATLNANVIAEYDFVFHDSVTANEPEDVSSQDSHGTRVFSIIGGFDDGKIVGPAFGASYLLAKTEDNRSETHVEEDNYAAALEWMDSIGVDITTSSLGYSEFDDSVASYTYADMDGKTTIVTKAAEKAFEKGILTITSAGNEGNKKWHYITAPADGINTLAIGAVDPNNNVASFSSRGPSFDGRIKPDLVARGTFVYSASVAGNTYNLASGTSMSSPIAAGVAGLLLSAYPELNNRQLRHILLETADSAHNPDNNRGYGLVSAAKAISFPNVVNIDGQLLLRKAFIDTFKIKPESVTLIYHPKDSDVLIPVQMSKNDFFFETPEFSNVTGEVNFWFEFEDSSGVVHRDPENNSYYWQKGGENVYKNLKSTEPTLPDKFVLYQNYPNPFGGSQSARNSITTIQYSIPLRLSSSKGEGTSERFHVILKVYDLLGREITTLVNEEKAPGNYYVVFNAESILGGLSSGVYFYTLRSGNFVQTKKMLILK